MDKKKIIGLISLAILGFGMASCKKIDNNIPTGSENSNPNEEHPSSTIQSNSEPSETPTPTTSDPVTTSEPETTSEPDTTSVEEHLDVKIYINEKLDKTLDVIKGNTLETSLNEYKNSKEIDSNNDGKVDYKLGDFYKDIRYTQLFDKATKLTENISLYAKLTKINYYNVTFINGENTNTLNVTENSKITSPVTPSKDGYLFKGWYENQNGDGEPFDFSTLISSNITLYAVFEEVSNSLIYGSYDEGMYLEFEDTSLNDVAISYAKVNDTDFTNVDSNLIRFDNTNKVVRCDIVGITSGDYKIKFNKSDGSSFTTDVINVTPYDRSGYAHFNYASDSTGVNVSDGIGAYKNDGTLKDGAVVVYVTDENKNTCKATIGGKEYQGLANILKAQSKSNKALDIRIVGTIATCQFNDVNYSGKDDAINTMKSTFGTSQSKIDESAILSSNINSYSDDLANRITKLNGLTTRINYDSSKGEYDSYFNMLDISAAKNVTVEGIGRDATIFQWGFTWSNSSSIEIRNLTFSDYTEDACAFQGPDDVSSISKFTTGHIWQHHNVFNIGNNKWDVCNDQDKSEGDGASDLKKLAFVTISYTHYVHNHKTGLIGGSDSQKTACVTYHHNYYENCQSRMPLGRQANIHMYNNYYSGSTGTNMSLRGSAYGFIENCYFENARNPIECKTNAVAKVYGSEFVNCKDINNGKIVTSREEAVANSNVFGQTFDTDKNIFYYDDINKKSNVTLLTSAATAKEDCINLSGVHKNTN